MKNFDPVISDRIGKKMIASRQTVAVAESATTGLLQFAIGQMENASRFWQGGTTVYNVGQKFKQLEVEPIHALDVNCVSLQVAREMARGVSQLFHSDWGIAITGYATPIAESGFKLYAYYAIIHNNKEVAAGKLSAAKNQVGLIHFFYVESVLKKWAKVLSAS